MEEMNKDTIKVLTVHGAKGLEAKKVAVIGVSNYSTEEKRIQYVAATRAKELLVWANIPKSRNKYGNKNEIKMEEW